ncbi:zinc-finger domain-containing protein [Xenorhabdus sp. DI]|nr:zinc-finger domain-containing protein [Xenorhabdus sp. 3]MBD2788823.1 zinc-finger domain-containing protein [Xenorhabdus sp. DI]MBD2795018.1 zinc-finger domain-containing protein [Xenorhabdus sp. 18]
MKAIAEIDILTRLYCNLCNMISYGKKTPGKGR